MLPDQSPSRLLAETCGVSFFSIKLHLMMRSIHTATTTAQKLKFSIKDFSSKCDQIRG